MPNPDLKKIKSGHKDYEGNQFPSSRQQNGIHFVGLLLSRAARHRKVVLYAIGVTLAVFAVLAPTLFYQPPTAQLQVAGKTLSLEIASTEAKREKGLGGRDHLAQDKGMLFVLDKPAKTCLWMKDTRFPLDMIWLDTNKHVIYLQQNVSPKTYPKEFCPTSSAKYIIELNAGQVQTLAIHSGQTLHL